MANRSAANISGVTISLTARLTFPVAVLHVALRPPELCRAFPVTLRCGGGEASTGTAAGAAPSPILGGALSGLVDSGTLPGARSYGQGKLRMAMDEE